MKDESSLDDDAEPPGRPANAPGVTAVVVHFRTPERLAACLEALAAQTLPAQRVVVVDNSGTAAGAPIPASDVGNYRWVASERNLGFGAACNLGARGATGEYLLFLNADLILRPEACERLCRMAENEPQLAVVGPRINDPAGAVELSARRFPTIMTGVFGRSSLATRLLGRLSLTPRGVSPSLGASRRVDWVSGACMLVRRRAFREAGGFDEGYWMYWEDADLCRRLRELGWFTALCVEAEAEHEAGSSGRDERTIEAFHASAARYYEQHSAATRLDAALVGVALRTRSRLVARRHARS